MTEATEVTVRGGFQIAVIATGVILRPCEEFLLVTGLFYQMFPPS